MLFDLFVVANCPFCDTVSREANFSRIRVLIVPPSFIVTLGWIMDKPMSLLFDPYESIVLFFTGMYCFNSGFVDILLIRPWIVLIVNYSLQDGKSNWMEGFLLMCECNSHICNAWVS